MTTPTIGRQPARFSRPREMILIVLCNMVPLAGVLAFGWPAGNVFLLFILENVLLGLVTLALLLRTPSTTTSSFMGGRFPALFFSMHYGIFAFVHAGFTAVVAYFLGIDFGLIAFAIPVVLLFVRYGNEFTEVVGGGRPRPSTASLMLRAYGRLLPLHLAVLVAFGLVISTLSSNGPGRGFSVPTWNGISLAALAVAILMALKTVSDLVIASSSTSAHQSSPNPTGPGRAMHAASDAFANGDVTATQQQGRFGRSWTYRVQGTSAPESPRSGSDERASGSQGA